MQISYQVSEITDYINWIYFFHAWGFSPRFAGVAAIHGCSGCRSAWLSRFTQEERSRAEEAIRLYDDARRTLWVMGGETRVRCVVELYEAQSSGDDILLSRSADKPPFLLPMLRQQRAGSDGYCLCLADFLPDISSGKTDTMGVFATSLESSAVDEQLQDDYHRLLRQTLSDRLAEAGAERLHQEVRTHIWGYAPDEHLSIEALHREEFQGIRPAVGYPCLPDMSLNFLLAELVDISSIGIRLTEHGMMIPHSSVSGLMLSHPASHYFSVGTISEEQLADYACRRGFGKKEMRKYIKSVC